MSAPLKPGPLKPGPLKLSPLKLGMVGGGLGGNIGATHRAAARLDGAWALTAGAFSSRPDVARASAEAFGVPPARAYDDWREMAAAEASRPDGIDAVAIVTPNHLHAAMAAAFLEAGIHVILDKPLTATAQQARALRPVAEAAAARGVRLLLTHPYIAYPMAREARRIVAEGRIGALRVAQVEYAQDWLARDLPGNPQAEWRGDPALAGPGGALGDIATHAAQMLTWISGARIEAVASELTSFVPGRRVDDDVRALLRLEGGARGMLWASQVAVGRENGLRLRLFGEDGSVEFDQEQPNALRLARLGEPVVTLTRGGPGTRSPGARQPGGHPEGYVEAFANLYADFAALLRGRPPGDPLPGLGDGLAGMAFIDATLASHEAGGAWTSVEPTA